MPRVDREQIEGGSVKTTDKKQKKKEINDSIEKLIRQAEGIYGKDKPFSYMSNIFPRLCSVLKEITKLL